MMEHLDIRGLSKHQAALGEQLARQVKRNKLVVSIRAQCVHFQRRLHLHNISLRSNSETGSDYVDKFGFNCTTCCGFIPMPNDWEESWTVSTKCIHLKADYMLVFYCTTRTWSYMYTILVQSC